MDSLSYKYLLFVLFGALCAIGNRLADVHAPDNAVAAKETRVSTRATEKSGAEILRTNAKAAIADTHAVIGTAAPLAPVLRGVDSAASPAAALP